MEDEKKKKCQVLREELKATVVQHQKIEIERKVFLGFNIYFRPTFASLTFD